MTAPTREVYAFEVVIPAGTTKAAPTTTNITLPVRIVNRITVMVPPGANGAAGFRVGAAGVQIVPVNTGAWVVANGEVLAWQLAETIESGAWQVTGYNVGVYDHTLYVRIEVAIPGDRAAAAPVAAPDVTGMNSNDTLDLAALAAQEDVAGAFA